MLPEKLVVKCVHSPSRVPGSFQARRRLFRTSPSDCLVRRSGSSYGVSLIRNRTATPVTRLRTLAPAKVLVQPKAWKAAAIGTVDMIAPRPPSMPVACDITGCRSAGNQDMTTRSTLMNTSASPTPSTARAASAAG